MLCRNMNVTPPNVKIDIESGGAKDPQSDTTSKRTSLSQVQSRHVFGDNYVRNKRRITILSRQELVFAVCGKDNSGSVQRACTVLSKGIGMLSGSSHTFSY